jgi:hypothetical protein
MPTPADPLAQLLAAVLAYRPQPWAWPRPRPPYLPHPRRRLPRVRGVVRVRSKHYGLAKTWGLLPSLTAATDSSDGLGWCQ